MHRFLKVPHWMIFGFCFGLPFLVIYLTTPTCYSSNFKEEVFNSFVYLFPFKLVAFSFCLGYFWSVGVVFQDKLELNLKRRSVLLLLSILTIVGLFIWDTKLRINEFVGTWNLNRSIGWEEEMTLLYQTYAIIFFINILMVTYLSYYAAKTYKTVEQQQKVKFKDFIKEFFLFLFLPIGIWLLQPKINQLYLHQQNESIE